MEFSREESPYQDWRSRAHVLADVPNQEPAGYIFALCVNDTEAHRPRVRLSDADLQRFGRERFSLFRSVLSDIGPFRGFHYARGFFLETRHWNWRRFTNAGELALVLQHG